MKRTGALVVPFWGPKNAALVSVSVFSGVQPQKIHSRSFCGTCQGIESKKYDRR